MHISIWMNHPVVEYMRFSEKNRDSLQKLLPEVTLSVHTSHTTFKESLEHADIALVWVFNQKWFAIAKKLKWIALPSAGKDHIHLDLPESIILTNSSFHGKVIAETVLGAMLGFSRGLFWASQNQNNLTVYVNDTAGNENSSTEYFFVDSLNPLINFLYTYQ